MQSLDRRELLSGAMVGAVAALPSPAFSDESSSRQPQPVIDTNISLF